jgi:dTDP-4-amino-4,6-dideoxygalactose transaminase
MWNIQLFKLNFNEEEVKAASDVIDGGWLSMGEKTIAFEENFANFLGKNTYCKAVSNGTAALHMALLALDVGEGDEVIIPSLTFVADINVVKLVGASPVLADAKNLDDWNMSLETIKEKVTNKTKAIIIVHYAGYPCKDILAISKFCNDKGIALIEDVAHAPGASVDGKKMRNIWSHWLLFFFSVIKIYLSVKAGWFLPMCPGLHKKLGYLRSHGMTSLTLDRT